MTSADSVTPVLPPLEVDDAAAVAWTEEADVVVVGWGAAGACAAIEARAQGASVIVVDRFEGGGASALSGGVVYAGGGTPTSGRPASRTLRRRCSTTCASN